MNDRAKLIRAIECYLDEKTEMDFMEAFASLFSSDDPTTKLTAEFLYHLSSLEYPDLRKDTSARELLREIKASLLAGDAITADNLSEMVNKNQRFSALLADANKEAKAHGLFAWAIVVLFAAITVWLLCF